MCVGVVIPSSVGQCASSSSSCYRAHTILTYLLRSINVSFTTIISTQWVSYPLCDPYICRMTIIMAPPWVPQRWPTNVSNWTKVLCASLLKKMTQDIAAVSSWSAFTEGHAVVQEWKTQHDKSTISLYNNIRLCTQVQGIAITRDQVSKSNSDIESLTSSLWHWVSDIDSLILSIWDWLSDINWYQPDKQKITDSCEILAENSRHLLGLTPDPKIDDDAVHTIRRLLSCFQRRVTWWATTRPKKAQPSPTRKAKTTTSNARKPKSESSPAPKTKNTSAPSLGQIVGTLTPPIKCTSDVRVWSTICAISSSTSFWWMADSVVRGSTTIPRGTKPSAVSSAILFLTVFTVPAHAQSPRFDLFQFKRSGRARQQPYFGRNAIRDPKPLSLVDPNSRRPKHGATSSPAHTVVGGTSPGNQYQEAREHHTDYLIIWMEDNCPVDSADQSKWPWVLRDFKMNLYLR